ncbi:Putative nuclease [Frankliniella fusca]|uniref:Nuclease n=1 Tax=Frankliniella fusca TaxID=407009 RepID=A0AAE1HN98_9NEOP|nr:Putative nuclease [Frankliniella fusca]
MDEYDVDDPEELDQILQIDPIHPDRLAYDAERGRRKHLLILRRRRIRDFADPFDVTFETFVRSYRLSQDLVFSLVDLIRPHVRRTSSPLALPLEKKVLAALSFFATGSYQTPTGKNFEVSVAQPTMSNYIEEVTRALNTPEVVGRFIRFPATAEEVDYCVQRNTMLGGQISNTVAYTDGSLIKIRKPSVANNRLAFMGRKSFASINVQITCDRRMYVNNVLARFPGSTNDSYIFNASALRRRMVELQDMRRCHLLGDSGYPLEPWMMTPFARDETPEEGTPESRYNKAHCSDRSVVERCIGSMKEVFRAINDERVLHYEAIKTCRFVVAITVLHNLRILAQVPHFEEVQDPRARNGNGHNEDDDAEGGEDGENDNGGAEGAAAVHNLMARGAAPSSNGHPVGANVLFPPNKAKRAAPTSSQIDVQKQART